MEFYKVVKKEEVSAGLRTGESPQKTLERILNAGLKAPSSSRQRQWKPVTPTDKSVMQELAKIVRPYPPAV